MDARTWLGLEPTHNPHRWYLPITPGISTSHRFLFGGCGLGAAIAALEGTSGRPVVWATAQYLSFARTGSILDIDVTIAVEGRATTQARAVAHVGGAEILTVNAALGRRDLEATVQIGEPPDVLAPDESPARTFAALADDSLNSRLDQRWGVPRGTDPASVGGHGPVPLGPGRVAVWTRMPELLEPSAASLAVLGDFVPMGVSLSLPIPTSSNSLDNTLRVIRVEPAEWYLLDIHVAGVHHGFGHGHVNLWSEAGDLLAVGSQSVFVRHRPADQWPAPTRLAEAPR